MAIKIAAQRTTLAAAYAAAAGFITAFTATPLTTGAATSEVTGGSPAFARKSAGWGTAAASVVTGTQAALDIPAGTTVTDVGLAASVTLGTADIKDTITITSQTFASQGQLLVTPTYTQA